MSTTEPSSVVALIIGPSGHGVVRHATRVAADSGTAAARFESAFDVDFAGLSGCSVVSVHYTDRLFGEDASTAARRFCFMADRLPGRLVVSMHDVPFADGSEHSERRAAAYVDVAAKADSIVVASQSEAERLALCGIERTIDVVRLPVDLHMCPRDHRKPQALVQTVGVVGFLYPGKGHIDVIDAARNLSTASQVIALGAASPGHDDVLVELENVAHRCGQPFVSTGYLDDCHLSRVVRSVDVGVVPARRMSASASLNTWLAAGRRPVVALNSYTAEIAAVAPNLMHLYDPTAPGALTAALRSALDDPQSTWHDGHIPEALTPATAAAAVQHIFERLES